MVFRVDDLFFHPFPRILFPFISVGHDEFESGYVQKGHGNIPVTKPTRDVTKASLGQTSTHQSIKGDRGGEGAAFGVVTGARTDLVDPAMWEES